MADKRLAAAAKILLGLRQSDPARARLTIGWRTVNKDLLFITRAAGAARWREAAQWQEPKSEPVLQPAPS